MFYCNQCAKEKEWPYSICKSYGKCEICGDSCKCNDMPSSILPEPKPKKEILD